MVPLCNLIIDITATDKAISERQFREQVDPCLAHLHALKGAFDRVPCSITYYPPSAQHGKSGYLSVRAVVMISVGKQRTEHLLNLYKAVFRLIELELPQFEVRAEGSLMKFS